MIYRDLLADFLCLGYDAFVFEVQGKEFWSHYAKKVVLNLGKGVLRWATNLKVAQQPANRSHDISIL